MRGAGYQQRRAPLGWPSAERLPFDRHRLCADLAVAATVCAVLVLFAISPVTLEGMGIAYITAGGGVFAKVHPATPLAVAALALRCLAARRPLMAALRLAGVDTGALLLFAAFLIMVVYASRISHTPFTPLIDTFALPVFMFLLLRDLDPRISRVLALVVLLIFCANAIIALTEFLRHSHLVRIPVPADVTSDPTRGDATFDWRAQLANDWRATALFGHPLSNGLATGAMILCLLAGGTFWIPPMVKAPVIVLQAVAMLAFGARTALVLTIVLSAWLGVSGFLSFVRDGRRLGPRQVAFVLVAVALLLVCAGLLTETSLFAHTLERFQNDQGSATTRITMFNLFDSLSWSDILLGPDPEQIETQQRLEGLEFGIESSWVGLVLTYGLVVTTITFLALAAFTRSVMRTTGAGTGIIALYFLVQASTAASLSTKTTMLALTTALVMIFLQKGSDRTVRFRTIRGLA